MDLEELINKVILKNINLFGQKPIIEKIDVGFTNTIYKINDKFILKICSNSKNESSFKQEIDFYLENKNNAYIPKLYDYASDKIESPYLYVVIEKLEGISLYNVWHILGETEREDIIKKLCEILKDFHGNKNNTYDWANYIKQDVLKNLLEAKNKNILSVNELSIIENALNYFEKYLCSSDFSFVHNDIHFDNIIYNNGTIKIIDFERSLYAPFDYEFALFFKMVKRPKKFAGEETEKHVNEYDYKYIMNYVKKYYPELFDIKHLNERLAIYDLSYDLKQYCSYPGDLELKQQVLNLAKQVAN